jgi:hypothetical protein
VACTVVVAVVESVACSWLNTGWPRNQAVETSPTVNPRSQ